MALRSFVDSAGREWQAFDVVPRAEDRRRYDRRSSEGPAYDTDDRRDAERRIAVGVRPSQIGPGKGWLCFEHGNDRRRLSPIPEDWARCSDVALEQYCQAARPARRSSIAADRRPH
jgi:hypothetical protein